MIKRYAAAVLVALLGAKETSMAADAFTNTPLASAIAQGREHRALGSAADAEQYAARIATATYGAEEAAAQAPFHAAQDGDEWRVVGSKPMDLATLSGPLTIVVERNDGAVRDLFYTAAPVGWDAGFLRATN